MRNAGWAVGLVFFACGGGSDAGVEIPAAGDGGAAGDAGGFDAGGCASDTDCQEGDFCSKSGRCIATGTCVVDGDCGPGLHCGGGSLTCLEEKACKNDGDCESGFVCLDEGICKAAGDCGAVEFETTRLAPNVLIVLDRSGSMEREAGGAKRWDVAKKAIKTITTRFDADVRFGLATFSACRAGGCSPGTVVVPVAEANAKAINDFLDPLLAIGSPFGTSPWYLCDSGNPETTTGPTLHALLGEPQIQDASRFNAILLVSDGGESRDCGGPFGDAAATELYTQAVPVETYAVGFSTDADMTQMDAIATAGGTGKGYYADDEAELMTALETIAAGAIRCDFLLGQNPEDLEKIYVYFNDDPHEIPRDPADGWEYDPATNSIHFKGGACDRILGGEVSDIDVVYGCPGPIVL
ncbi:MAG: VWA domain-containing protein [Deltaproteobacteria bacterium]|nr:VWA domain-containing protein [Deltaproteobacteria bacterium]